MEIGKMTVSGYEVLSMENLDMTAAVNEHSRMRLCCLIEKEKAETYMEYAKDGKEVSVRNGNTVLFCGVTTKVRCFAEKELMRMELLAQSGSIFLDQEKRTRSFQNTGMPIQTLIDTVLADGQKASCTFYGENKAIGVLTVQYQETNWEFLKRMASKDQTGIYPGMVSTGIKLTWGCNPGGSLKEIHVTDAAIEKETKRNIVTYELKSDSFLLVGDQISYKGQQLYICRASYSMKKAGLEAVYWARAQKDMKTEQIFQDDMAGSALEGKIIAVSGEQVKVHLTVDEAQDEADAYWFPFSAMTAASDGSGWYYMPEVGDCVKVCLPDREESHAFAVSAVSDYKSGAGEEDRMGNTDVKYMRNPSGKDLMLAPDRLKADSNGGQSVMELRTDGTASLSGKDILSITASGDIEIIAAKEIEIQAAQILDAASDMSGELLMDESGEIKELGGQVNLNMEE